MGIGKSKIDDDQLLEFLKEGKMTQNEIAKHFNCSPAAITKRKQRLEAALNVPDSFKNLTDKEQKFVLAKVEGKTQTQAALDSFECGSMDSAKNIGSQLMQRGDIQKAVSELMHEEGLTKRSRVQVLKKHVYAKDANISLKALDQSWKLDGAYTEVHEIQGDSRDDVTRALGEIMVELARRGIIRPTKVIGAEVVKPEEEKY